MLLKVVKSPVSRHLPAGARCYGLSHKGTLYNPTHFVQTQIPDDVPIVFVFGAMASGSIDIADHPYVSNIEIVFSCVYCIIDLLNY